MWDIILNPFVTMLTWLYALLNQDIVLAIVVLTVIIRFLTYPLLARQQESQRKMQQVQPQLKKLQEKFKNDKEKLSQAQMKLYREKQSQSGRRLLALGGTVSHSHWPLSGDLFCLGSYAVFSWWICQRRLPQARWTRVPVPRGPSSIPSSSSLQFFHDSLPPSWHVAPGHLWLEPHREIQPNCGQSPVIGVQDHSLVTFVYEVLDDTCADDAPKSQSPYIGMTGDKVHSAHVVSADLH